MRLSGPWWVAPAVLLAAFYLFMAGQNLRTTSPRRPAARG